MSAELETQEYVREGRAAWIWFSRPEVRNATNMQFYVDLNACLDLAEADPEVRVVVLAGRGPIFCAGQDLKWTATIDAAGFHRYEDLIKATWERLRHLPKPVIARVHGHAYGGGMYLATHCDLITMKSDARMAMREIFAGSQSGGMHLLTVGKQRAMEINLLGRQITGVEAERWDLVNACFETEEELDAQIAAWVDQLVDLPPLAIAETKAAANFQLDAAGFALFRQAPYGRFLEYTEDFLEAKRSWVEKRPPDFQGR